MLKCSHSIFGQVQHPSLNFQSCIKIKNIFLNSNSTNVNYTIMSSWSEKLESIGPHLQGEIDMWIGPSSQRQLPKKIPFDAYLGQSIFFASRKFGHNILYVFHMSSYHKFKYSFSLKLISSSPPSKLEGQNMTFLEIEVSDLYTQFAKLSSAQLWSCPVGKKTLPNLDVLAKIYGLQTRKVTCGYILHLTHIR